MVEHYIQFYLVCYNPHKYYIEVVSNIIQIFGTVNKFIIVTKLTKSLAAKKHFIRGKRKLYYVNLEWAIYFVSYF